MEKPKKEHERDEDCDVDQTTSTCRVCGVYHGDPCEKCSGRGFHRDNCPLSDATKER